MIDQKATHRRIAYLVYLSGVEVPALSVSVNQAPQEFPTAAIALPPDRLLLRIGRDDRMRATIFYLDTYRGEVDGSGNKWRLLFDGEVMSSSYMNSPQGRSVTLNCIDLVNALARMKMFFLSSITNIVQDTTRLETAAVATQAHYQPTFPASLFFRGLEQTKGKEMQRPYDFVDNMFRAVFGDLDVDPFTLAAYKAQVASGEPKDLKSVVGLHFFSRWARRTNFHRRWMPMPLFENNFLDKERGAFPVLRAVQSDQAIKAVQGAAGRLGDDGSLWDLLRSIYGQMYYEVGIMSSPSAVRVNRKTGETLGALKPGTKEWWHPGMVTTHPAPSTEPSEPGFATVPQEVVTGTEGRLTSYVTKPQLLFAVPPACNVVWKSMILRHQYSENYSQEPTRLIMSEGNLFNTISTGGTDANMMEFINQTMAVGYPQDAQDGLDRRLGRNGNTPNLYINPHNYLVWPEEFFKGPVYVNQSIPSWFMYLSYGQDGAAPTGGSTNEAANKIQKVAGDLSEFFGKVDVTGVDAADVAKLNEYSDAAKALAKGTTVTGQATVSLKTMVTDANNKYRMSKDEAVGLLTVLSEVGGTAEGESMQRTYQLYARYEFFRKKYASRNGGVQMIFNPYIVPGYPMVVWDDDETQFSTFGYAFSVSHTLSPGQATTSVSYTFGRTFEEFYKELLGAWTEAEEERFDDSERRRANAQTKLTIAAEEEIERTRASQLDIVLGGDGLIIETEEEEEAAKLQAARDQFQEDKGLRTDSVPANPIDEIRVQFQHNDNAAEVYKRLFYQSDDATEFLGKRKPIFDVWSMVDRVSLDDTGLPPVDPPVQGLEAIEDGDKDTGYVPSQDYRVFNENPDEAMRFASRPICTLEEWVNIQQDKGVSNVEDSNIVSAEDPYAGKGAPYMIEVLQLVAGPGDAPTPTPYGNINGASNADTRLDWNTLLKRFRQKFYYKTQPKNA